MYSDHVPLIAEYALAHSSHLFRVGLFVQATISQRLECVPMMVDSFDREGFDTRFFCGWQRIALQTLLDKQEILHRDLRYLSTVDAMRTIVELPGFGIVKAGFFCQLLGFDVGCLDRHNLRLAGLQERTFQRIPASAEGLTAKIEIYLDLCQRLGGSEYLWNRWCTHLSQIRPKVFPTPEHVSKLHVECILRGDI